MQAPKKKVKLFLNNALYLILATRLFGANENLHRSTLEIPPTTQFVFQESSIWLLDILRQIGIEYKCGNMCIRNLGAILYLDVLTLD